MKYGRFDAARHKGGVESFAGVLRPVESQKKTPALVS